MESSLESWQRQCTQRLTLVQSWRQSLGGDSSRAWSDHRFQRALYVCTHSCFHTFQSCLASLTCLEYSWPGCRSTSWLELRTWCLTLRLRTAFHYPLTRWWRAHRHSVRSYLRCREGVGSGHEEVPIPKLVWLPCTLQQPRWYRQRCLQPRTWWPRQYQG